MKSISLIAAMLRKATPCPLSYLLILLALVYNGGAARACSTYKITDSGRTVLGANHDTWLLTPKIWFEATGYGAAFTGARFDGGNGYAPQSGMNEYGLAFTRLATVTPPRKEAGRRPAITNQTRFLKAMLHRFKTVDEVKAYVDQYDHSLFMQDVLLYTDRSGKYLVIEPFTTITGNDPQYVLANFCPSTVKDPGSIRQARYTKGVAFLKNKPVRTDLDFCTALSDTMHVCRDKIGDGTLLTSIWDTDQGTVCLYFYHDYSHRVIFRLQDELRKGDHVLEIPSLFPPNKEFKRLAGFKTPVTSSTIDILLKVCLIFFLSSALFFLLSFFRRKGVTRYRYLKLLLVPVSIVLAWYMFVLETRVELFYFPAPYKDYQPSLLNLGAYIPFMLLVLLGPALAISWRIFRQRSWPVVSRWVLVLNSAAYLVLVVLCAYWGLYNVWHA